MGLTSALNTSLSGLTLTETSIDILGNNIANAGTNGFKASRAIFTTQLSQTLSVGSGPTSSSAGTNPRQIGMGATSGSIVRDFTQGGITNSTSSSDMAIQGSGFFVLQGPEGNLFTRDGSFLLNSQSLLSNPQGLLVQGYGVNDNFELVTTSLGSLEVPLGDLNIAQQTSRIDVGGALFAGGEVSSFGSVNISEVLTDNSTAAPITLTSLLTDVRNSLGQTLFVSGQEVAFTPIKAGRPLQAGTLDVTPTTTVADWLSFMDETLGIHSGGTIPNDGGTGTQPGVSLVGGAVQVVSNRGSAQEIVLDVGQFISGGNTSVPLTFAKTQQGNGEGASTDFVVYDSLGQEIRVRMTTVLESRNSTGTTFRYFIESADDSRPDLAIANGTISFNGQGKLVGSVSDSFTLMREETAAVSPMQITLNLRGLSGISSPAAGSALKLMTQDGAAPGTLVDFSVDEAGVINGIFDNGIVRKLGQVVLARFTNDQGLVESGGGTYKEGVSSGSPFIVTPGTFGVGSVRSGAIELSNTDVGRSLVDLIVATTNYRGNARVISSVQQLVDELLILGR